MTAVLDELLAAREAIDAQIDAALGRRRAAVAACGTDSGYYRHLRHTKTPPCDACRTAHSLATRIRAARRQTAQENR